MNVCLRRLAVMAILLYSLAGVAGFGTAHCADRYIFQCQLVFPGNETAAQAEVEFQKSDNDSEIRFTFNVRNLADITMAHLHIGLKGGISTPVVWLYPSSPPPKLIPGPFDGILAEGTITARDLRGPLRGRLLSALINEMEAGNTYVNIHTREHPGGSICGQVGFSER